MRRRLRQFMPRMFYRRLLLVLAVMVFAFLLLGIQMVNLTLGRGAELQSKAESVFIKRTLIPTVRGRILDRKGRILATDRPAYQIAVHTDVLTGDWSYRRARWHVYRMDRARWREMSDLEQEAAAARVQSIYDAQVKTLWWELAELGGVTVDEIDQQRVAIVRKLQLIKGDVAQRQYVRRSAELDEPIDFAEAVIDLAEERGYHAIIEPMDQAALLAARRKLSEAHNGRDTDGRLGVTQSVWQWVRVTDTRNREYPHESMEVDVDRSTLPLPLRSDEPVTMRMDGVGIHLIGAMRPVWAGDAERLGLTFENKDDAGRKNYNLYGYRPGDRTGQWGVEATYEKILRGARGQTIAHLDTDEVERTVPVAGRDVRLSIDIHLQARVQALMTPELGLAKVQPWRGEDPDPEKKTPRIGDDLPGAAVVMEIDSGEVLAAVSMPGFSREQLAQTPEMIFGDPYWSPFMNRVLTRAYQPGSVVKPLLLTMGVSRDVIDLNDTIADEHGYYLPSDPNHFRNWSYNYYNLTMMQLAGHALRGDEAVARSCNIYFFTVADRLGAAGLIEGYGAFGAGRPTGSGLPEIAGELPDLRWLNAQNDKRGRVLNMGIGQGPIRWTPIQAANAYAALARGGFWQSPKFVVSPENANDVSRTGENAGENVGGGVGGKSGGEDLYLNPGAVRMAIDGMWQSANEPFGSTHFLAYNYKKPEFSELPKREPIFNVTGVQVFAKSGTADAVKFRRPIDDDGDGYPDRYGELLREGDHAWVGALLQPEGADRPTHVVMAVLEYAGSGGKMAGPIVNQIIHAMQAEGYF